ncbi:MAG: ABC transporter ATP-binding protein [Chloroflexi bacterium]|nr:ABC transporter ATP-binding protein [Chloroflexota bacterium]
MDERSEARADANASPGSSERQGSVSPADSHAGPATTADDETALPVLETRSLAVGYREGIDILRGIDLTVRRGAITSIIGPNGAGKSTLLRCLFGLLSPRRGDIHYAGRPIADWSSDRRKSEGIAYLPQHHSTFPHLTVEENLKVGGWLLRRDRARLRQRLDELYGLFPVLAERRSTQATNLSGGQLRQLAVAKEIVVPPHLLLVDEPSVGMAPKIAAELYDLLERLVQHGITILLVDQNIVDAVRVARRVYLLGEGRIQRSGSGRWFEAHLEDVIREMLTGETLAGETVTAESSPAPRT